MPVCHGAASVCDKEVLSVDYCGSLSQWLNMKLSGITCLVGKNQPFKPLSQGPGRLSEVVNRQKRTKIPKVRNPGHPKPFALQQ